MPKKRGYPGPDKQERRRKIRRKTTYGFGQRVHRPLGRVYRPLGRPNQCDPWRLLANL